MATTTANNLTLVLLRVVAECPRATEGGGLFGESMTEKPSLPAAVAAQLHEDVVTLMKVCVTESRDDSIAARRHVADAALSLAVHAFGDAARHAACATVCAERGDLSWVKYRVERIYALLSHFWVAYVLKRCEAKTAWNICTARDGMRVAIMEHPAICPTLDEETAFRVGRQLDAFKLVPCDGVDEDLSRILAVTPHAGLIHRLTPIDPRTPIGLAASENPTDRERAADLVTAARRVELIGPEETQALYDLIDRPPKTVSRPTPQATESSSTNGAAHAR